MALADIAHRKAPPCKLNRVAVIPVRPGTVDGAGLIAVVRHADGRFGLLEEPSHSDGEDREAARAASARGGLAGTIDPVPIGAYLGWATTEGEPEPCMVNLFVLHADTVETGAACLWLPIDDAVAALDDERLAPLVHMAAALVEAQAAA